MLDDWLGPTLAIIQCHGCHQYALIHLLAWSGKNLSKRIFAVRELPAAIVATYLRNISRDYCDLTRKVSETDALLQAAAKPDHLILVETPSFRVDGVQTTINLERSPRYQDWQEIKAADWCHWETLLRDQH